MSSLQKSLTTFSGTALMMNMVVGAGLLSLPLIAVFVIMGRRYPNAGGVAHFAAQAFGSSACLLYTSPSPRD